MWVNAAKERKLGHAQLYWCVCAAMFFLAKNDVNRTFLDCCVLMDTMGWVFLFVVGLVNFAVIAKGQKTFFVASHLSFLPLPAVHELTCPWTFWEIAWTKFSRQCTPLNINTAKPLHSQSLGWNLGRPHTHSNKKCVSQTFFSSFRESFKLKFLIFSRYFFSWRLTCSFGSA